MKFMKELKKELITCFESLGIKVYTNTKARGHQGFFRKNRIDISKNIKEERIIPTLLHEFAHFIHEKIEPDMVKTGGSLDILFNLNEKLNEDKMCRRVEEWQENYTSSPPRLLPSIVEIEKELLRITNFIDENSLCHKFYEHKEQVKKKIKTQENIIKQYYPSFMRSKKFKEFDKYIKKSKAKYLLKYDRVKFVSPSFLGLLKKYEVLSIDNLEHDFPEMPTAFCSYIRLKSLQKKQARISAKINKLNKYYSKPTELFARLVEGLYLDGARVRALAPNTTQRFFELLEQNYYYELKEVFNLLQESQLKAIF